MKILFILFFFAQLAQAQKTDLTNAKAEGHANDIASKKTSGGKSNCLENGATELNEPLTLPLMIKDCDAEIKGGKIGTSIVSRFQPLGKANSSGGEYSEAMAAA